VGEAVARKSFPLQSKVEIPRKEMKEFRKTNDSIGLRVAQGKLSLLSRKLFNVMVYHAQRQQEPGCNAPIATQAAKKYFWIPLAEVARDAAYDSNDTDNLKLQLDELQNVRVYLETDTQWASQRLISAVTFVNPMGLKTRGGQLWLGFAFPPEVHASVMSPGRYTQLTIYYQSLFRSGASLALYEICRKYLTNPSKVTNKQEWAWWYGAITGNPVNDSMPEYKYFKRDVIKSAINEVNRITDINIDLIEHCLGRKVQDIQFKVEKSRQAPLPFHESAPIDQRLLGRIMALGINQQEAAKLVTVTDASTLSANLALVEARMSSAKQAKLDSPAAYFKQALKNNYATAGMIAKESVARKDSGQKQGESKSELRERFMAYRANDAFSLFNEYDDEKKDWLVKEFKKSAPRTRATANAGMESALFRYAFSHWYAMKEWGDPTEAELLEYALKHPRTECVEA
jgi:hypothetical protein